MKNLSLQGSNEPTAFVTVNKQRIKQYDQGIVYLKHGQEFEIELFNPTQSKVLAKIELNGHSIGNGVVIKPGQRAYLERYIDEARKFLFEIYEIDANDPQSVHAIAKNGIVKIQFYSELNYKIFTSTGTTWTNYPNYIQYYDKVPLITNDTINSSKTCNTNNAFYSSSNSTFSNENSGVCSSASIEWDGTVTCSNLNVASSYQEYNPIETGRIEKGKHSNQSFESDYNSYNWYPCATIEWTIRPESRRAVDPSTLTIYCTECGAKRKKSSHKFCPHCGTKF